MCVCLILKVQEKAEKASRREHTLKEVESSTKDLRDLLERQAISGTVLELGDDVVVCVQKQNTTQKAQEYINITC